MPVAIAPRGFRAAAGGRVKRVTAAFGGGGDDLVVAAAGVAAEVGATLRIVCSPSGRARRTRSPSAARPTTRAISEWVDAIRGAQQAALERVAEQPTVPSDCEAVVGRGEDWEEALDDIDWETGDVLVVGSSSIGPLRRVFLGSRSEKIVEHSPVPVVVVPRGVAEEAAADAV